MSEHMSQDEMENKTDEIHEKMREDTWNIPGNPRYYKKVKKDDSVILVHNRAIALANKWQKICQKIIDKVLEEGDIMEEICKNCKQMIGKPKNEWMHSRFEGDRVEVFNKTGMNGCENPTPKED